MSAAAEAVVPLFWRIGWALPWAKRLRSNVWGCKHIVWRFWWMTWKG